MGGQDDQMNELRSVLALANSLLNSSYTCHVYDEQGVNQAHRHIAYVCEKYGIRDDDIETGE